MYSVSILKSSSNILLSPIKDKPMGSVKVFDKNDVKNGEKSLFGYFSPPKIVEKSFRP